MATQLPPVPPENRSPKGPDDVSRPSPDDPRIDERKRDASKQGRQGNTKINTTHQGYQQDR
ncbi:MAG: hypothetical protein K0S21_2586 [Rhizobiaceae bacterium]|jgi:hypothetical protein|nr:hypothetical protein [Rhizobiaceae bacterium]